jgi:hypothetical protein
MGYLIVGQEFNLVFYARGAAVQWGLVSFFVNANVVVENRSHVREFEVLAWENRLG